MEFAHKEYFLLLLLLIPYIIWYVRTQHKHYPSLQIPTTYMYKGTKKSWKNYLVHAPFILRVLIFSMLVCVIARPQTKDNWQQSEVEGIDVMLAMDISTSMLAQDLQPNRIEATKKVATAFINSRPNDNIGLTVFAGESYTQCPLTIDHSVLLNLLQVVGCEMPQNGLITDGTALGMGLANAVSRLKDSQAKSKVVILLTDGMNNSGEISPLTAAELAKQFGIRVYTIGAGTTGMAPYPVYANQTVNVPVEIDEKTLSQIAAMADGKYFRATSTEELQQVYEEIDRLEKTRLHVKEFSSREEKYAIFGCIALLALLLDILLRNTLLKQIP